MSKRTGSENNKNVLDKKLSEMTLNEFLTIGRTGIGFGSVKPNPDDDDWPWPWPPWWRFDPDPTPWRREPDPEPWVLQVIAQNTLLKQQLNNIEKEINNIKQNK